VIAGVVDTGDNLSPVTTTPVNNIIAGDNDTRGRYIY
jgi:hypothetical protein